MSLPEIRVLAVSAPQWSHRPEGVQVRSFSASSPFSLQNAVRAAAGLALSEDPVWARSNWGDLNSKFGLDQTVKLIEFFDEAREEFQSTLEELKPDLLFIGAMSISLRGAIELAKIAKSQLGQNCLVVLGGKHCNETLYRDFKGNLIHAEVGPLNLMQQGHIEKVDGLPIFDLVCSGEGEELIAEIGRAASDCLNVGERPIAVLKNIERLLVAKGHWIVGFVENNEVSICESTGANLQIKSVPVVPEIFQLESRFSVFGGSLTGHVISDMGRGCRYDCYFCSERSGLNGKLRAKSEDFSPVARLIRHFKGVMSSGQIGETACFVEDSILLGGNIKLIDELIDDLTAEPIPGLEFGCQLTVNDVEALSKARKDAEDNNTRLAELKKIGLSYIAIGLETVNEEIASRMSKHRAVQLWAVENHNAIHTLASEGFKVGVYLLWGLGEKQSERTSQLKQILHWQNHLSGQPSEIGLNWATHHPGNKESGMENEAESKARLSYDYLEWGTPPNSKRLPYFVELFGEATENYSHRPGDLPSVKELEEIKVIYDRIAPISERATKAT